ncbi:MAG: hypothetical protein R3E08_12900 [Thiotrichaceae bacterium]
MVIRRIWTVAFSQSLSKRRSDDAQSSVISLGGNITINNTFVGTRYAEGGGNISISGGKITMNNSGLDATTIDRPGGKLKINADELTVQDNSWIASSTYSHGMGGAIDIKVTGQVNLLNNSTFDSNTYATQQGGNAGEFQLEAAQLNVSNSSIIGSNSYGDGHGGNIYLNVNSLTLGYDSEISTDSRGNDSNSGNAGEIAIEATQITSQGLISSDTFNSGSAGFLTIRAQQLLLENGASIVSATHHSGAGGIVLLNISDALILRGQSQQGGPSAIFASSTNNELEHAGDAGYVLIEANQVSLENAAIIRTDTLGTGNAGNLFMNVQHLKLTQGSQIGSITFGSGQGGNTQLIVSDTVMISGAGDRNENNEEAASGIFASSENRTLEHAGNAGNIYLEAGHLQLLEGGHIDSATMGTGKGGNAQLSVKSLYISGQTKNGLSSGVYANSFSKGANAGNAGTLTIESDHITLAESGSISTQTSHAGGGNIEIATNHLLYLLHGSLTTSVHGGIGNGGNITVQQPEFIVLNQGDIRAQADEGHGGSIYLAAQQFLYSTESVISASSQRGMDGEIWIDSPENSLHDELLTLPAVIPLEMGLKTPCSVLDAENMSSLAVAMNHNIPNLPDDLQSSYLLEPLEEKNSNSHVPIW